jgi:hypothetical protein
MGCRLLCAYSYASQKHMVSLLCTFEYTCLLTQWPGMFGSLVSVHFPSPSLMALHASVCRGRRWCCGVEGGRRSEGPSGRG